MSDPAVASGDDEFEVHTRVEWSVPEVAATAVLVLVCLLAAGGLATGIITVTGNPHLFGSSGDQLAALGTEYGASWAGPLLAIALVAVLGVAWWQAETWADAVNDPDADDADDASVGAVRLWRSWQLRRWAQFGLLVTAAGSVAGLAGALIASGNTPGGFGPPAMWAHDVLTGAEALGTLLVAAVGFWIASRVQGAASLDEAELG
jgi:hypothetical protein